MGDGSGDGSRSKARSIKKKKVYKTGKKEGTLDRQHITEGMRVQGMKRQSISSEQSKLTGIVQRVDYDTVLGNVYHFYKCLSIMTVGSAGASSSCLKVA